MRIDFDYLCRVTANLSGIPVRVYKGEKLLSFHSPVALVRDPMLLCKKQLWSIQDHVGYCLTEDFYTYGILTSGDIRLIVGPTRQIPASEQELREFAFQMGLGREDAEEFSRSIKAIVNMPVESLLLMLCSINYMVNGEKLELRDLTITTGEQETLDMIHASQVMEKGGELQPPTPPHNSYSQEQAILRIVRKGDTAALHTWVERAPAIRGGILSQEHMRQMKNLFIVTATLCSRAAIGGGLDVDDAFSLSDSYIQSCERLDTAEKITNLQYHMVLEFTERVSRLHLGEHPGKLAVAVANYVQHHLSESISTEALAQSLFMGRSYLSTKFHSETGIKLNDFILQQKTEEAKRLLRYTDRSAAAIGEYLAFSSPAHFTRVFKKYVGLTPNEYREKHS
jgi:AraC-like DNA-binding protein